MNEIQVLISILFIIIDIIVLMKVLKTQPNKPVKVASTPVSTRPVRSKELIELWEDDEDVVGAEELEELIEELRERFKQRHKDWNKAALWNKEENLRRFRIKNGIEPVTTVRDDLLDGLFRLNTA